jgi:hypothetical protein
VKKKKKKKYTSWLGRGGGHVVELNSMHYFNIFIKGGWICAWLWALTTRLMLLMRGIRVPMKNKFYKPTHNVILAFKLNVIYLNVGIFWKILA